MDQPTPEAGVVELDLGLAKLRYQGKAIALSRRELSFLEVLATAKGSTVPHARIIAWVFGEKELEDAEGSLRVMVSRLRAKLPEAGLLGLAKSSFGAGYRLGVAVSVIPRPPERRLLVLTPELEAALRRLISSTHDRDAAYTVSHALSVT